MAFPAPLADVVIESERLHLLPTSELYADEVFANFTATITEFMGPAPPRIIDDTLNFLRAARSNLEAGTELQVVILLRPQDEFIGHSGLHHIDTPTPELGIWVKQSAHGHGYGREAIRALCEWALAHLDFEYLKYPVDRRNVPSRRIPESLGGRVEAEYSYVNAAGNQLDLLEYRIRPSDIAQHRGSAQ